MQPPQKNKKTDAEPPAAHHAEETTKSAKHHIEHAFPCSVPKRGRIHNCKAAWLETIQAVAVRRLSKTARSIAAAHHCGSVPALLHAGESTAAKTKTETLNS